MGMNKDTVGRKHTLRGRIRTINDKPGHTDATTDWPDAHQETFRDTDHPGIPKLDLEWISSRNFELEILRL